MSKNKRSKINKMEKLRQILDNPYDPKIKKSISKDDESLESIHRKLSGESSIGRAYAPSSETLAKKSDSLEPRVAVRKKKKKITQPKTKQIKVTDRAGGVKDKPFGEDFYEVEKADVSEREFLEVKPKEVDKETKPEKKVDEKEEKIIEETPRFEKDEEKTKPQTSPEKIISGEPLLIDKKDKIAIFQEIEIDEIYRKTKRGVPFSDKIQMYRSITIIERWAFTLTLGVVAVSGLFLMRDWLFLNFGVYGDKFIPTPGGTQSIHIWFGFAFAVFGLFHLAIHIFSKKKDILPKQTLRDFKAFLHSGMYLIGLARREDYGACGRFNGRQRITYLALVYILGLTILTGLLYYMNFLSYDLAIVHVIPAGLSIMVLLFQFLITIRKHDTIALNCAFITGKLPRWYARKNHPIWYKKVSNGRESILKRLPHSITVQTNKSLIEGGSDLTNAVFKFFLLLNDCPDKEDIKAITDELQATIHPDKLERIIELAEQLEDETEGGDKQEAEEELQQTEEESTELEEPPTKKKNLNS